MPVDCRGHDSMPFTWTYARSSQKSHSRRRVGDTYASVVAVAPAVKSWARLVLQCLAVTAVLVAAQLGVGHGLGVIGWSDGLGVVGNGWSRLLTWVGFVFAVAVLGGVAAFRHIIRTLGARVSARVGGAAVAAVGAGLAFPLVWLPVRAARPSVATNPEMTIAVTAGVGIAVGVVLALWALASTVIARAVLAGVVWGWLVALVSVAVMASRQRELSSPRLGMLDVTDIPGGPRWLLGPNQMIIISAAVAAGIAWYGRRSGAGRLLTALSGLACPALIASAYVLAGPGFRDQNDQLEAYFAALAATLAGLLVSVLFALWKRATEVAPTKEEPVASDAITWPAATV